MVDERWGEKQKGFPTGSILLHASFRLSLCLPGPCCVWVPFAWVGNLVTVFFLPTRRWSNA